MGTIETIIPCTTPHSTSHKQELFLRTDTCTICGHVYNPEKGESLQDIRPGVCVCRPAGRRGLPDLFCVKGSV
ncbi:MAG: rubredoxin [Methanoregula sp.]